MKSLFLFLIDMYCAAVDAALHCFDGDDDEGDTSHSPTKEQSR